jgi:hypothetical protein
LAALLWALVLHAPSVPTAITATPTAAVRTALN